MKTISARSLCRLAYPAILLLLALAAPALLARAQTESAGSAMPRLVNENGHHALMVDGKPFFVLGGQINNSSSWPGILPHVWPTLEGMHANTMEAPVYWEQMEPQPGTFDFSAADMLVKGAREHHLRLVILWFGTWKNGEMHYVPEWIKTNSAKYPRMIDERGEPVQVLSANSTANLDADKAAFRALMRHLREIDGTEHTVIMVQVENESGGIDAVRDHSPSTEKEFNGAVPASLVKSLGLRSGTWREVFGANADESFQAYSVANYINQVAAAGKAEFPIPYYCNVWIRYPRGYEIRGHSLPGYDYPSGGPMQGNIPIWKAVATSIDMLGPDIYSDNPELYNSVLNAYDRKDNPVWVPETGFGDSFSKGIFYVMNHEGIGFSPFGTDQTGWNERDELPRLHAQNYALLAPMDRELAQLLYQGKVKTATEAVGQPETSVDLGKWRAEVRFGFPQPDGAHTAPGTPDQHGRVLIAETAPDTFLVAGFDSRVTFRLKDASDAPGASKQHAQILRADEGTWENGEWRTLRILNGDQTDRGLNFRQDLTAVRIHLGTF